MWESASEAFMFSVISFMILFGSLFLEYLICIHSIDMSLFFFPGISKVSCLISSSLSFLCNCRIPTLHIRSNLNKKKKKKKKIEKKTTIHGSHSFGHDQVLGLC